MKSTKQIYRKIFAKISRSASFKFESRKKHWQNLLFQKIIESIILTFHKYLHISQTTKYYRILILSTIWCCWNW